MKHNHGEAFMLMAYAGSGKNGTIHLRIWNSRDGVTPLMMHSKEFNIQLQHSNWGQDKYMPDYKPKKGDLIWRDLRQDEAIEIAETRFDELVADLEKIKDLTDDEVRQKYSYDARSHMARIIAEGKEHWVASFLKTLQPGDPHLELVKEDWA